MFNDVVWYMESHRVPSTSSYPDGFHPDSFGPIYVRLGIITYKHCLMWIPKSNSIQSVTEDPCIGLFITHLFRNYYEWR